MTYHALLEYIRQAKELGSAEHEITAQLTNAGWYSVDVQDALRLYGTLTAVHTQPEPATPAPKPSLTERLVPRHYDPHLVAVASVAFATGFVGYLLIAAF